MRSQFRQRIVRITLLCLGAVIAFTGCVSRKLADRPIEGEPLRLIVRVTPDARVQTSYSVTIDANDPVGSLISIGTTAAKADQVYRAERRMDEAMRSIDLRGIVRDEIAEFFEDVMEMPIVESARDATYTMTVEVSEYGINARRTGSSISFILSGRVELYDPAASDRIWSSSFSDEQQVSPALFGLPAAAGNILSAAMLADLTEEEMAAGIERVARNAAWSVGDRFQRDLYRARRR